MPGVRTEGRSGCGSGAVVREAPPPSPHPKQEGEPGPLTDTRLWTATLPHVWDPRHDGGFEDGLPLTPGTNSSAGGLEAGDGRTAPHSSSAHIQSH